MSPSLRMELKPSMLLPGSLVVVHLLAVAAASTAMGGWPLLLVAAGVVLSGAVTVMDALHRTARGVRVLELHADGRCAWRDGTGHWREGRLHGQRFVASGLIVLALKGSALRRRWIVLLPDSSDGDSLRRLRGWLRWRTETQRADEGSHRDISEPGIKD